MPRKNSRKNSIYDSKDAETCPCSCCRWHSSRVVRSVLGAMFILIVIALIASVAYSSNTYFEMSAFSFVGVIFIVVFIGWGFSFFCSCRGIHWARHGYGIFDGSKLVAKSRYANGEISRKEYENMMRDLQ